nr:AP2/ERF and B3 domain-containing transcription factor At1g50680-like [Tanacetum cinerariifolium]
MGVSEAPGTPPISIPDLNYGNNCHKEIDNYAYSHKYKGVVPQQNGHRGAQLYTNNQRIWLGTFKTEKDAAMAYDRASIKLRSDDSPRYFPWSQTTDLEAKFPSHLNMEVILKMIKDETYESKFNNFLREKTGKEKEDDLSVQKNCDNFRRLLFEKELTPSDVGKLRRLVIPKKFVVAYFPPVPDNDDLEGFVNDEVILPFYDVDNKLWKFRYCYWKSSQSFLFTRGWNQFVKEKKLMANDKISFYYNEDLRSPNSSYFEIGTSLPKSNIGASLKLGMETQVGYMESKEDEGIVEDREISDESGEGDRESWVRWRVAGKVGRSYCRLWWEMGMV